MKVTVLFLLLLLSTVLAVGQGTYPLAKGNLWQYWAREYQNGQWAWIYKWTEKIIGDTLMPNGKIYAVKSSDERGSDAVMHYFMRQEGPRVTLGYNPPSSDVVLYDFSRTTGDTIRIVVYPRDIDSNLTITAADGFGEFFGLTRRYQDYLTAFPTPPPYVVERIVDGIGRVYVEGDDGTTYWLRGVIIDSIFYGTIVSVFNERTVSPASLQLEQNYPNPFNTSTSIRYGLSSRSHVTLTVFNTLGQQAATLVQGEQEAGFHEAVFDAKNLASGVYLYRLTAGSIVETRKLVLLR